LKGADLKNILDGIDGVVLRYEMQPNGSGRVNYISEGVETLFGVSVEEAIQDADTLWSRIVDEDMDSAVHSVEESAKSLSLWDHEFRIKVEDEIKWILGRGTPQKLDDGTISWDIVDVDITALKKVESNKDVMLKEIHHRVKNNLAIIAGLMDLEIYNTEDERLKLPLKESQNRIFSVAKVHELLYGNQDLSSINLEEYLEELVEIIQDSIVSQQRIKTYINAKNITMNIHSLIPLGILMNELLTNSFKYAFPEGKVGQIDIRAEKNGDYCTVIYRDNGVGFQKDVEFEAGARGSLGLVLVNAQLKQLGAEYQVCTKNKFELEFKF
jgi:two-component sensor histidine kinase